MFSHNSVDKIQKNLSPLYTLPLLKLIWFYKTVKINGTFRFYILNSEIYHFGCFPSV
jgi:hypothetical protein